MSHCSWGRVPGSGKVPVWEGPSARDCDNSQLQLLDLALGWCTHPQVPVQKIFKDLQILKKCDRKNWDGEPSTVFSKDLVLTGPDWVLSRALGAITADSFKQLDHMCDQSVASCARGDRQRFESQQSCFTGQALTREPLKSVRGLATP